MNNVWTVALKTPCTGLRLSSLSKWSYLTPFPATTSNSYSFSSLAQKLSQATWKDTPRLRIKANSFQSSSRTFAAEAKRDAAKTPKKPAATTTNAPLPRQHTPLMNIEPKPTAAQVHLSESQVTRILGPGLNFEKGMQVLQDLQFRRVTGSLGEQGISFSNDSMVTESHSERGLAWLREQYPVDEAAAAAEWAEEEAERLEAQYTKRAERLRLYQKIDREEPMAEIQQLDSGGLYGQSVLEQRRKQVTAQEKAEEEKLQQERQDQPPEPYPGHDIIVKKKSELDERRQRKQEYKQKLAQAAEISTAELLAKRSALSRLWAPTLFALVVMAASVIFAESYEPPALSMRLLPSIPPAVATCGAIVLMNLALFIAWRSPQAWRTMNRYFLLSSGHPNSISTLGSIFSHQSFGHFAKTMALMMVIGIPVHEEIGRGAFIAVYLCTGLVGSLTTLTYSVLSRDFLAATIGASGAAYGLVGAYLGLSGQRYVRLQEWNAPYVTWIIIATLVGYEGYMFFRTRNLRGVTAGSDHLSHLGGLIAGGAGGYWLRIRAESASKIRNKPSVVDDERSDAPSPDTE